MKTHPHTLNITLDENGLLQTTEERPVLHKAPATTAQAPQTSHSPLPWHIEASTSQMTWLCSGHKHIATIMDRDVNIDEDARIQHANAALIVRACNEYEELLKSNRALRNHLASADRAFAESKAHAQRLADALKAVVYTWEHDFKGMETGYDGTALEHDYVQAREALAQYNEGK